ncbi:MAG: HD domain-containing protein [Clostridia bacterium]|nr:HD domain-containing protein [Clostridia bacterium]
MKVPAKLKQLATLFAPHATLYAVGGFVRDSLLCCEAFDIDVCSKLRVEDVKTILLNSDFVVSDKNLRMGTVHISSDDFDVEYTTFRTDSYDISSGAHSPDEVNFTDDITLDARRRDFKCNAVYLDILRDEIVDPLGGVEDIKNAIISTADNPDTVFEADGLRILRLVRFASELGFDIESETLHVAIKNAWRVKDIAPERIRDELSKIFASDTVRMKIKGAHLRGFRRLDELGLIDLLLPEIASLKGLEQKKKYHLYNAYEHSVKAFELAPPRLRWVALMHDLGKRIAYENNNGENMHGHDEIGAKLANGIFERLKFSNAERDRNVKLIAKHMVDIKGDTSWNKLRRFAVENCDIIDNLCVVKDIDAEASCGYKPEINRVRDAWEEVKRDGTPLSVKDLKVDGNDLIALGVESKSIGVILNALFEDTILNPILNDRERALEYVKRKRDKLFSD